jgi:hypothetical protein
MILFAFEFGFTPELRAAGCQAANRIVRQLTELSRKADPEMALALAAIANAASGLCALLKMTPALAEMALLPPAAQ